MFRPCGPAGFAERDWALVVHRGERLADGGVEVKDGRIVSIRMESGKIFRAGEFLDCSDGEELLTAAGLRSSR